MAAPFFLPKAQQSAALAAGVIEDGEELEIVKEKAKEDRSMDHRNCNTICVFCYLLFSFI